MAALLQKERPRLSGALRAFSAVSRPDTIDTRPALTRFSATNSALAEKLKKQKQLEESGSSKVSSWTVLCRQLTENCQKKYISEVSLTPPLSVCTV